MTSNENKKQEYPKMMEVPDANQQKDMAMNLNWYQKPLPEL